MTRTGTSTGRLASGSLRCSTRCIWNPSKTEPFPEWQELCRKDLLVKNLKRMKLGCSGTARSTRPKLMTSCLCRSCCRGEYAMFVEEFKRSVWRVDHEAHRFSTGF